MPIPTNPFSDEDVACARRAGEKMALAAHKSGTTFAMKQSESMALAEEMFPDRTDEHQRTFANEIKDAADRFAAKLKDLVS